MNKMDFLLNKNKFKIKKNDSQYLTKFQIKKVQFLFENDYFIWNEAEMYLRFHEFFSNSSNSDYLYENVCSATRVVFKIIHDVHFSAEKSNAAHLKFFEVLDAWGALSFYIKNHDNFPPEFINWFKSIYDIYESKDHTISFETILRLFLIAGSNEQSALNAYQIMTARKKIKLNFDRVVFLLKQLVVSNDATNFCHDLIPKLKNFLLFDKTEKPTDQVLRNYDYELNDIYSNLSDWNTSTKTQSTRTKDNEATSLQKTKSIYSYNFEDTNQRSNYVKKESLIKKMSPNNQETKMLNLEYLTKNSFKISEFKREFKDKSKIIHNKGLVMLDSEIFTSENGSNTTGKSSSLSDNEIKREKKKIKKLSNNFSKHYPKHVEILTNIQEPVSPQFNYFEKKRFSDSSYSRNESKSSRSLYENRFRRRSDTSSVSENMYEDTLVSSSPTEIKNFSSLPQSKQERILRSILDEISSLNHKVDSKSKDHLKSKNHRDFKLTNSSLNTLDDVDSDQNIADFYSNIGETDFEENFYQDLTPTKYFNNYKKYFGTESPNKQAFNLDQDWSLSQNSNLNLSINEHRVVNEIFKKLKPFMVKCVRKEVRKYFQKSRYFNKFDSSTTKIGDF